MILLDTSFLIELLSEREAALMKARQIDEESKAISSITLYELFIGAQRLKKVTDIEEMCETMEIIAPDERIAKRAAFLQRAAKTTATNILVFPM